MTALRLTNRTRRATLNGPHTPAQRLSDRRRRRGVQRTAYASAPLNRPRTAA